MSKRLNLREFQQRVIERLQDRERSATRISTLGVQIAGRNWLIDMSDLGEVLPLPALTPVPFTQPWFLGVANIRGNLYTLIDMAAYQRAGKATGEAANRVLLVGERLAFNAGLLVDRVLGLRDASAWQQEMVDGQTGYRDEQGMVWQRLDVPGLLAQSEFLQVGI